MPDSLLSLLEYLRENPHVRLVKGELKQNRKFQGYKDGNIHWKLDDGSNKTTPVMCVLADGVLDFDEVSFTFKALNVEMKFEYKEVA